MSGDRNPNKLSKLDYIVIIIFLSIFFVPLSYCGYNIVLANISYNHLITNEAPNLERGIIDVVHHNRTKSMDEIGYECIEYLTLEGYDDVSNLKVTSPSGIHSGILIDVELDVIINRQTIHIKSEYNSFNCR